jgi:hypothetical protein
MSSAPFSTSISENLEFKTRFSKFDKAHIQKVEELYSSLVEHVVYGDIDCNVSGFGDLVWLFCDAEKLSLLFLNHLINRYDFTSNSEIWIRRRLFSENIDDYIKSAINPEILKVSDEPYLLIVSDTNNGDIYVAYCII